MSDERTLFIVRHAKSSWDIEDISDTDRPLKLKGIRDAYDMARRIKINHEIPGLIISSPANRALHTACIFANVLEVKLNLLRIDERLYGSGIGVIRKILSEQDSSIKSLMVFGHNPDFSELATSLSGSEYIDLPTCGVCKITFNSPGWGSVSAREMIKVFLDFPKKDKD
ncbi:MAG: histidine phosphatase family protein [Bacteroidales bacterium]|nr:histidine phosphatase family protein [Bacteroidales bacterium]